MNTKTNGGLNYTTEQLWIYTIDGIMEWDCLMKSTAHLKKGMKAKISGSNVQLTYKTMIPKRILKDSSLQLNITFPWILALPQTFKEKWFSNNFWIYRESMDRKWIWHFYDSFKTRFQIINQILQSSRKVQFGFRYDIFLIKMVILTVIIFTIDLWC